MTIATSLAVVAALCVAAPAHAQQPEAESRFREGKALLKKGKIAEACAKFEASEKIDPTVGTELNLADCREKNKQYASAWAMFLKAATTAKKAKDTQRATEAKRRAKLLEPKLKYLTIKVAEDRRVTGLVITRDGTALDPAVWNQRVPVDPGAHDIAAKAPGRENWKEQVEVEKADEVVEVPLLAEVSTPPPPDTVEPKPKKRVKPEPVAPRPRGKYRGLKVALFSLSSAGLAAGVGFGLYARSVGKQADEICPNENCLDESALDLNKRARNYALIANASFAAGGALLAASALVWWLGKDKPGERVTVVPTAGNGELGVTLGGRF
jgi:hypothetical protein